MGSVIHAWRTTVRAFGFSLRPLPRLAMFQARRIFNLAGAGVDHLLYPGLRSARLDRPVFVLGNARSGTTLMHRLLAGSEELTAFELWEMLFPSITGWRLLRPLAERLAARVKLPHDPRIHETGLLHAETDDLLLFANHLEGPLYQASLAAWDPDFQRDVLDDDAALAGAVGRGLDALDAAWRRKVVLNGRRVLAKSSGLTGAGPDVLARYPDARLLYMVRSPLEVIPSGLSLLDDVYVREVQRRQSPPPEQLARYYEHMYQGSVLLYRRFHEQVTSGRIPAANLKIVAYPRLMADFAAQMAEVFDFVEIDPAPLASRVAALAPGQRRHSSGHRYSLERYGLSEARVRRDLSFIFDHYDVG
ncbi:MAG TPA: sulfotransferase [Myxococcota bacterium]|nr:sulfotransferase [Myxococcota bacterium]